MSERTIYLDHAATTPCDPRVIDAMLPFFREDFGNPSSGHDVGRRAAAAVEEARSRAAELVGASATEIIWTSGATEANNLALFGFHDRMNVPAGGTDAPHIITTAVEHSSIYETCLLLKDRGAHVSFIPVCDDGHVDSNAIADAIDHPNTMVSVTWANNEVGTINDISAIGAICRERGALLHVDGTQIVGKLPADVERSSVDLLSWSSHKIYGPKGVGALYIRRRPRVHLQPRSWGGGQEHGIRAGTLNVPGIVGFGRACELRLAEMGREALRLAALRDSLEARLLNGWRDARLHGSRRLRLPHLTNVGFGSLEGRLIEGIRGVACSTGAACSSGDPRPSRVLLAMGVAPDVAKNSLRLSLGKESTAHDVDEAGEQILRAVRELAGKVR